MTISGSASARRTPLLASKNCATASPPPISARAVLFQARNVRSLASVKRESGAATRESLRVWRSAVPATGGRATHAASVRTRVARAHHRIPALRVVVAGEVAVLVDHGRAELAPVPRLARVQQDRAAVALG